jgi:chaperonin GroEL
MKKVVITGKQAKEQLLDGAKLLYEAVSTTLGPKGQNAFIGAYGAPIVTHDGVTVAKSIENVDGLSPGAEIGIEMIKSSSSKTNDNVGDGTTTSTILTYHLMSGGMQMIENGKNPMMLRRELDKAAETVLDALPRFAEPIKTKKAAVEIATISSESKEIGEKIGEMYHTLGKDGMVVVELGTKPATEYEIVEGYVFDKGLLSPMMILDQRTQTTRIEHPHILLYHGTVGLKDTIALTNELFNLGHSSLVIIADDFREDLLQWSLSHIDEFTVIGIKAPGFGEQRMELLRDLAAFTGTEVTGKKFQKKITDITVEELGTCEEIVSTPEETIITGGRDVTEYITDLSAKLDKTKTEFDRSKIEKRIAQLRAKVGQIRVGGNTEMEAEERKYLIDDAVAATEAALKEGVVPGGGMTYIRLASELLGDSDGDKLLREALKAPFKVLMENAGLRYGVQLKQLEGFEFGMGYDIMGDPETPVNLKEHGIIDPALVIKQAVLNATSVAGSALTAGVLIARKEEDSDKKED